MNPRDLPPIHRLLEHPRLLPLIADHGRDFVKALCQEAVEILRREPNPPSTTDRPPLDRILDHVNAHLHPSLVHVINATGTVLHTNLGRAPLAASAIEAVRDASLSYSNLEIDISTGQRGHRSDHIDRLLRHLTGAEAGFAVNNNAGAVLLALAAIAAGREVIVSRGELIEIGGGFRIPDVMAASGAILREVGTTNRTHVRDYEQAIGERSGLLFKAHWSNFSMTGFTSSVSGESLVELGRRSGIPVMYDLGSGCLVNGSPYGWQAETVPECIRLGFDLVTFSGDKLLGGPQAGILCGRKDLIARAASHPLARALRIDKLTLAALEATLRVYRDPARAWDEIPVLRTLSQSEQTIRRRVINWIRRFRNNQSVQQATAQRDLAVVGGGALPGVTLPTWGVILSAPQWTSTELLDRLRKLRIPVIARIRDDAVFLDFRTIQRDEETTLIDSLVELEHQAGD